MQTTRLWPKARPLSRMASAWSGATSERTSAHAQPAALWPEGYEPCFASSASSAGVQVGAPFERNGRFLMYAFFARPVE